MSNILEVKELVLSFITEEGEVEALDGVSFSIEEGSVHGLIGETGCGKSVTGLSILQLLDANAEIKGGEILYQGENLLLKRERAMEKEVRGNEIAMIFQDPGSTLNPVFTIENQMAEVIKMYQKVAKSQMEEKIMAQLSLVKLPDVEKLIRRFPYELSGGMKQRVMIAMMLACGPNLLIADEPTTALDVSIQAQFIKVLRDLQESMGMSILYITHDLAVVSEICNYVSVMYAGRIVENVSVEGLFADPVHPYSNKLVHSIPGVETTLAELEEIPGSVPNLIDSPPGCRFHPRCEEALAICQKEKPVMKEVSPNHYVACHRR